MRPVNKGATSTGYCYVPTSTVKTTSSPNRQTLLAALQAKGLIAGALLTLGEVLEAWCRHVDDPTANVLAKPDLKTIEGIITPEYKQAALPLVQELGSFCSYCETYIPGLLEVEHVCPKSEFPLFALEWDNFLLACGPCNTSKSSEPNRGLFSSSQPQSSGWSSNSEQSLKTAVRQAHVWPDTDPASFREFKPVLSYFDSRSGDWLEVDSVQQGLSTDPGQGLRFVRQDFTALEVIADIPNVGNRSVQALLVAQNVAGATGQGLIDILKLNTAGTTVYDRRVINRTTAWFAALSSVEAWKIQERAFSPGPPPSQIFDAWLQNTIQSAANKGFFSVWIQVLRKNWRQHAPTNRQGQFMSLADEFLQSSAFPAAFPNTNLNLVP